MYLVEISSPTNRGVIGSSGSLSVSAGITLCYCLGAAGLDWRHICMVCAAMPAALWVALALFLPETPAFLAANGREAQARKVQFGINNLNILMQFYSFSALEPDVVEG